MYFLYRKDNGEISPPVHRGEPSLRAINKETDCELGSGIRWNESDGVDLFYAPDNQLPSDFARTAALGKYYIENNEIFENLNWEEPEEEEWE